jgi:hypothetical protein
MEQSERKKSFIEHHFTLQNRNGLQKIRNRFRRIGRRDSYSQLFESVQIVLCYPTEESREVVARSDT